MRRFVTAVALAVTVLVTATPASGVESDPVGHWPLTPRPAVVGPFDPPATTYGAGHRGVDLAGRAGQPVRVALRGTVTHAAPLAGRGVVVVEHGDTRTTYEPVTASVSVGDVVPAGAQIGTLELMSSHCFPQACLHWGWLRGSTYLDPLRLVGGPAPVRLLPLWRAVPVADAAPRLHRGSRSGMRLPVGAPQPVGRDMGVALGGGQRRMAEELLHRPQVSTSLQQVRGRRVP